MNCWVVSNETIGSVGETWIEDSVAEVTVRSVLPDTPPNAAVIVAVPGPTDVARPCEPGALLITATAASDELQTTSAVRSCVVLSEKVPVATN